VTSAKTGEGHATIRELRLGRKTRKPAATRGSKNPLRAGLRIERVPDPHVVVLFGATGDLAHRKVVPALFHLWVGNLLPERFALVCFGRRPFSDQEIRSALRASLDKHARITPVDEERWASFASRITYHQGGFDEPAAYTSLSTKLAAIDTASGTDGNRLYYLATPASSFPEIVRGLGAAGLDHETADGGWRRIVIEKPFGRDLETAVKLNREVGKVFRESQVYRIDHYLGKETVRNILIFRFGNLIFEPIWHRRGGVNRR
jgi:glucose-6-phosphate 1-dehydrogenase